MIDAAHMHDLAILVARIVLSGCVLAVGIVGGMVWRSERAKLRC
jgi:type IV secretory pathway TrbF-like protein